MVRGWLEPLALICLSCQAGLLLAQGVCACYPSDWLSQIKPYASKCPHCAVTTVLEFEEIIFDCDGCGLTNTRFLSLLKPPETIWQSTPDEPEGTEAIEPTPEVRTLAVAL